MGTTLARPSDLWRSALPCARRRFAAPDRGPGRQLDLGRVTPARGLALGAALSAAIVVIGTISLALPRRLDSGTVAAAPVLGRLAPTRPRSAWRASARRPDFGAAAADAIDRQRPRRLVAANRLVLDQGLTTAVPSNMRPSLGEAVRRPTRGVPRWVCRHRRRRPVQPVQIRQHLRRRSRSCCSVTRMPPKWFPPLQTIANQNGLATDRARQGGCPAASVSIPTATSGENVPDLARQGGAVHRRRTSRPGDRHRLSALPQHRSGVAGRFQRHSHRLKELTPRLLVLGDNPDTRDRPCDVPVGASHQCAACVNSRAKAIDAGKLAGERAAPQEKGRASSTPLTGCARQPTAHSSSATS